MRRLLSVVAAGCMLLLSWGKPHAQTLAELLDGRRALQCYHNDTNVLYCKDLLSGETWEVFTRAPDTWETQVATINREGTKLTCTDGHAPVVINLDGTNKQVVAPEGTNQHFWRDDEGYDWVVYTGENEHKNRAGTTWKVRIDGSTNVPVESTRTKIADIQFSCGFNGSGVYLGESYGTSIIKNIVTGEQSPDFNDTRNCVGSMHPGDKPWIMFEESPAHDRVGIFEWNEAEDTTRRIWRLEKDSIFGLWSPNDENYCVILNDRHNAQNNAPLDLVKLSVDTSGTGDNDGSWEMAPMGISGMVGGPWVEPVGVGIRRGTRENTCERRLHRGGPELLRSDDVSRRVHEAVRDLRGRTVPIRRRGSALPSAYFVGE